MFRIEKGLFGTDETTIFTNAKKNTLWTWQTKLFTYLKVTNSRQAKHIDELFPDGLPNAVLNSDQYVAHINTTAKAHQICWAHIFRKIKGLRQIQKSKWLTQLRAVIDDAYLLYREKEFFKHKSKRTKNMEHRLKSSFTQKTTL